MYWDIPPPEFFSATVTDGWVKMAKDFSGPAFRSLAQWKGKQSPSSETAAIQLFAFQLYPATVTKALQFRAMMFL